MSEQSKALERPRFFPRQMITDDDLGGGIDYLRSKARRHNRALHGWGIVNGLAVFPVLDDDGAARRLRITPGFALSPQGDEIEVLVDQIYDTTREPTPNADSQGSDPWTSDVVIDRRDSPVKYLAIRYNEVLTRLIRVAPSACDCGGTSACEPSRYQDAYTIELRDTVPPTYDAVVAKDPVQKLIEDVIAADTAEKKVKALLNDLFGSALPAAQAVPTDPWVVLADVEFVGGVIKNIKPDHRRMVVSLAPLWWKPTGSITLGTAAVTTEVNNADPTKIKLKVKLTGGEGFTSVTKDSIKILNDGGKIQVESVTDVTNDTLTVLASFPADSAAALKQVLLLVERPNGLTTFSYPINIPPPTAAGGAGT